MNNQPLVEMLAYFVRFSGDEKPGWRKKYMHQKASIRSCHSKIDGGVKKSFYSIETKAGKIINLIFDEEELIWELEPGEPYTNHVVDRVLAFVQRHKHLPSRAHRIIPYRFEIIPKNKIHDDDRETDPALVERMQPFRFQSGKMHSMQVVRIVTRHLENVMITKHLHYVVETDSNRFFHLVYILDEADWRFMQEVDEELFFVK
ncbi:MAG: hypothetical protein WD022_06340 [Balneolaceae bacterium]